MGGDGRYVSPGAVIEEAEAAPLAAERRAGTVISDEPRAALEWDRRQSATARRHLRRRRGRSRARHLARLLGRAAPNRDQPSSARETRRRRKLRVVTSWIVGAAGFRQEPPRRSRSDARRRRLAPMRIRRARADVVTRMFSLSGRSRSSSGYFARLAQSRSTRPSVPTKRAKDPRRFRARDRAPSSCSLGRAVGRPGLDRLLPLVVEAPRRHHAARGSCSPRARGTRAGSRCRSSAFLDAASAHGGRRAGAGAEPRKTFVSARSVRRSWKPPAAIRSFSPRADPDARDGRGRCHRRRRSLRDDAPLPPSIEHAMRSTPRSPARPRRDACDAPRRARGPHRQPIYARSAWRPPDRRSRLVPRPRDARAREEQASRRIGSRAIVADVTAARHFTDDDPRGGCTAPLRRGRGETGATKARRHHLEARRRSRRRCRRHAARSSLARQRCPPDRALRHAPARLRSRRCAGTLELHLAEGSRPRAGLRRAARVEERALEAERDAPRP